MVRAFKSGAKLVLKRTALSLYLVSTTSTTRSALKLDMVDSLVIEHNGLTFRSQEVQSV